MVEAIATLAIQAGMNPDIKEFSFVVGDGGDVSVKSTAADGTAFEGQIAAADIAKALGMDPAEDAGSAPPAKGDSADKQPPPPPPNK